MAWEWSHSIEAYQNARKNVHDQGREWLRCVYAEWVAREGGTVNPHNYAEAYAKSESMPDDVLADFVWEKMEEHRRCTDGGHLAYGCPFGCLCHLVSFDRETQNPIPTQPE